MHHCYSLAVDSVDGEEKFGFFGDIHPPTLMNASTPLKWTMFARKMFKTMMRMLFVFFMVGVLGNINLNKAQKKDVQGS
jgi:hypothetical protein